jgi:hypothetical protein
LSSARPLPITFPRRFDNRSAESAPSLAAGW